MGVATQISRVHFAQQWLNPLSKFLNPPPHGAVVVQFILALSTCICADYRSAVMIDEAKKRESEARRTYEKMKKNRSLKLYDKPPHLRNTE